MSNERPDPDKLLSALQKEDSRGGKLRIYLGYAAGVGKSYAMMKGAHELQKQGVDVIVGYLEAHGRMETEGLTDGLEVLPPKEFSAGGAAMKEFDLDAALKRKPQVILVDEMAHTNADGGRHAKRWQDIEELLDSGINVHTTLNVQHLASLNDIVAQITGVQVRETMPDSLFDKASEVTLVDITPDELLKRLKSGKVYRAAQAERALGNYFKKSNLVALREIALRRTAERVHADVTEERLSANIQTVLPTQERLACIIDSDEASMSALRVTARMAGNMQCTWTALCVSSAGQLTRFPREEAAVQKQIQLVADLGGKVVYRSGAFFLSEVLRWAREENITKLLIARPRGYHLEKWIGRLLLFFAGRDIDILWVHPTKKNIDDASDKKKEVIKRNFSLRPYIETTAIILAAFAVAAALGFLHAPEADLAIIYLLGVIVAAVLHGEGASAYAALISAFILSFGLTNFTWRASWMNAQYLIDFGLSLGIGLLASQMTSRLKNQAELARKERELAESLYNFTTTLTSSTGLHQIVATAQTYLQKLFARPVIILLPTEQNSGYRPLLMGGTELEQDPALAAIADWAASHHQPAGAGTQTLPHARALYIPLMGSERAVGVLAISRESTQEGAADRPFNRAAFEKFANPLATKIESAQIAENAENIYWQAERERLRGDLLSSVSEGLKMPLAILAATSSSLVASTSDGSISRQEETELLTLIRDESIRLQRLVDNLTQLTRFEIGSLPLHLKPIELNEFIQSEVFKLERLGSSHRLVFKPYEKAIRVNLDTLLFSQVIFNIVDNAVQYTQRGSQISASTTMNGNAPRLIIDDDGEGIPEEHMEKIFEKYYRLSSHSRGAGLGLTVCRAIVEAHNAHLWAENRTPKGLRVIIEFEPDAS